MASPSKPSPRRESTAPSVPMAHSPPLLRTKSVRGYLPMTEEPIFSTRGQNLPQLLSQLGAGTGTLSRRGSSFILAPDDEVDLEADTAGLDRGRGGRDAVDSGPARRWGSVAREARDLEASGLGTGVETNETNGLWPLGRVQDGAGSRRSSDAKLLLMTPQMRSMRLIGHSNPRYKWERYFKSDEELQTMKKPIREYYERNNYLIQQYVYIDRLLDSSLPHNLIQEYHMQSHSNASATPIDVPNTISEERGSNSSLASRIPSNDDTSQSGSTMAQGTKIKRTPRNLYKLPDESTPLISIQDEDDNDSQQIVMPPWTPEEEADSGDRIVTVAIYVNLVANTVLLLLKIVAMVLTSSVSVLAALVDAILDFLSTAIVWTTTRLISTEDQYKYPVGRRRLEPIGVLVFSVIMVTSFFQVALEGFSRLSHGEHVAVSLGTAAILIMTSTVVVKGACWIWCRLIKNSSVQALAQDAQTDVVFNTFSIIFPLVGYYADIWFLDSLGGILLSLYVIYAWSRTTAVHVRNLSGAAATADERNVLLYLTMRFAKTIKQIQGLQAYHAGDKLNVEVDIVVDENMRLRDSHDLGESLQYVLESVPTVDRAFVHLDYAALNLPTHMRQ